MRISDWSSDVCSSDLRVKRVYVQGDAPYRASPEDLGQWFVRSTDGQMSPFSAFATMGWSTTTSSSSRFQGVHAFDITGQPTPGTSTGAEMDEMERLENQITGTQTGRKTCWTKRIQNE